MKVKNIYNHFIKICKHKYLVFEGCCRMGIIWQGIKHDMSKFSPVEFWESVKYYQGNRSPIEAAKEDKGYCAAWLHHQGHNKHHWQYWVDFTNGEIKPQIIPLKYLKEMYCDVVAASRAYNGKNFSYRGVYEWWINDYNKNGKFLHPITAAFMNIQMVKSYHYGEFQNTGVDTLYTLIVKLYKNNELENWVNSNIIYYARTSAETWLV